MCGNTVVRTSHLSGNMRARESFDGYHAGLRVPAQQQTKPRDTLAKDVENRRRKKKRFRCFA